MNRLYSIIFSFTLFGHLCNSGVGFAGDTTAFPRGLSMQPAIGWYRPSFDFYNKQYARVDNNPFTNDFANSYILPDLPGNRELGFEIRLRLTQRVGIGLAISAFNSEIRAPLIEPGKPTPLTAPIYAHHIDLLPVLLTAFLYQPVSRFAEIYLAQVIGIAKVEESANIFLAGESPTFEDASNATALLFGITLGVQHIFAGNAYLFVDGQYILGGYVANGWKQPLDPLKSTFLHRGSVSLAGPRVRVGMGFTITRK
jgi:hypothetical protein